MSKLMLKSKYKKKISAYYSSQNGIKYQLSENTSLPSLDPMVFVGLSSCKFLKNIA